MIRLPPKGKQPAGLLTQQKVLRGAVALFLEGTIGFLDIYEMCAQALRDQPFRENPTIQEILEIDRAVRRRAASVTPA